MTDNLKPYPEMKESDVEWLGALPAHWKVLPNRAAFVEVKEPGHSHEQMLSVTISSGVIRQGELIEDTSKKDQSRVDKSAYKLVQPDDIAYNKMRAWQGAIGVSRYKGIVSPAYIVQRPLDLTCAAYAHHLFRTPAFTKEAERRSYGITSDMWSLRSEDFKTIRVCIPPLSEQTAIVRFLDHADRRIQRYIRAKEKLIALLEEQKQAIVHQAVTGRIDVRTGGPYPAYKPSGVEWLGDVPAHWQLRRLKFLTSIASGQVDPRTDENKNKILIAPNHILPNSGQITDLETADTQGAESGKYEIYVGDVIYSKIRPNLRKAAISPLDGLCSADMYPIRVRKGEIETQFFLYLLLSNQVTRYTVDCSLRVAMPKVNREALGNCWLAYPKLREQQTILDYISKSTANTEILARQIQSEISLLREYRTRLVTDVVTGKLDVREAADTLPEVEPFAEDGETGASLDAGGEPALDDHEPVEVVS